MFATLMIGALVVVGGLLVVLGQAGRGPLDLLAPAASLGRPGVMQSRQVAALATGTQPTTLVPGPKGGAFFIDSATSSVWRVNTRSGKTSRIVRPGVRPEGSEVVVGRPVQLTAAGSEVIVVDDAGLAWAWRPIDRKGDGTLVQLRLQDEPALPDERGPVAAYDPQVGHYRLYAVDAARHQIIRYQQGFDGSSFTPPSPYLERADTWVDGIEQLYLDFDLYALAAGELRRYAYGKRDWMWMPVDASGTDYRLITGSGRDSSDGRLYLYDAANARIVALAKSDGSALGQWSMDGENSELIDVRGMYAIEGGVSKKGIRKNDTLVWVTPGSIYEAKLLMPAGA